jgi:hypothetical protein
MVNQILDEAAANPLAVKQNPAKWQAFRDACRAVGIENPELALGIK